MVIYILTQWALPLKKMLNIYQFFFRAYLSFLLPFFYEFLSHSTTFFTLSEKVHLWPTSVIYPSLESMLDYEPAKFLITFQEIDFFPKKIQILYAEIQLNTLTVKHTQTVGKSRRFVWVCLTILWGWCLKD